MLHRGRAIALAREGATRYHKNPTVKTHKRLIFKLLKYVIPTLLGHMVCIKKEKNNSEIFILKNVDSHLQATLPAAPSDKGHAKK